MDRPRPERASSLGLLGAKANLAGLEANWRSYSFYLSVVACIGGMLLLPFIVAFLFGREYADGTAKNLLGLPIRRAWFVVAKLVVAAGWWVLLVAATLTVGFGLGSAMNLPDFSTAIATDAIATALLAASGSFLLAPVYAWITIATRNYLAALGFALGMLLLGNLLGHTGWATWFPWSVVPTLIGMTSTATPSRPWASYLVLGITFLGATIGSVLQLTHADNP